MDINNSETENSSEKERIFCSGRLYLTCEIINGILFLGAITLIAVGTYNVLVMKMKEKECAHTHSDLCSNKSTTAVTAVPMVVFGCVLLAFCALLFGVMLFLARKTMKYVRRFSDRPPVYGEAIHSIDTSETRVDDVWAA